MQGAQQATQQVVARVAAHNEHLQELIHQGSSLVHELNSNVPGEGLP